MEKPSKPLAIGVIGCGDIGSTRHIPTIYANQAAVLSVLCDTNIELSRKLALEYEVPRVTNDYLDVLRDESIDAVVVSTPPWITPSITMDALRSGKHVLSEKPMALDVETAENIMRVEQETGRKVQIGFTYRHGPLMDTMQKWIREGRLGFPLVFRISVFDEFWDPHGQPQHYDRIYKTMERSSPSIHEGAHIADFLHFLTDSRVVDVRSLGMKSRPEFPSTNYEVSVISFANGSVAKVEIGWFFPKFPYSEFEVMGPSGIMTFDRTNQVVKLQVGSITQTVALEEDLVASCFRIQLEKFIHSIRSNEACMPGSAEGLNSLKLTKQIQASLMESPS